MRDEQLNKLDMEIQGTMLKIKRYETELEQTKKAIRSIQKGDIPEHVGMVGNARPSSGLWKQKETQSETEVPKRSMSRGKLLKGSMYKNKPVGIYKVKINELLDQLEENNQTILL